MTIRKRVAIKLIFHKFGQSATWSFPQIRREQLADSQAARWITFKLKPWLMKRVQDPTCTRLGSLIFVELIFFNCRRYI